MKKIREAELILDELLELLHFSKDLELAKWLGVSAPAISQDRKKGKIPESWLVQVAMRTNRSIDELLFDIPCAVSADGRGITMVPLVTAFLSEDGHRLETEPAQMDSLAFRTEWLLRKGDPANMMLMRVSGDSMEPVLRHNDIVLIDRGKRNVVPHTLFAIGVDDEIYIKQLETYPGHKLVLRSYNEKYAPIEIDMKSELAGSINILGKVLWWCHSV